MLNLRTSVIVAASVFGAGLLACGPSFETDRVMTPEERLQEEERKAYEAELAAQKRGDDPGMEVEEDETEQFDKKGAKMELQRASLSAETCPEVVEGQHPKAMADLSITFVSDGSVKDATISPPFEGDLAECILTAYKAVIVKPFREPEATVAWQLDLTGAKKKDEKKAEKAKK